MKKTFKIWFIVVVSIVAFFSASMAETYTQEELGKMEIMKDNISELQLYFISAENSWDITSEDLAESMIWCEGRFVDDDDVRIWYKIPVENRSFEAVLKGVEAGEYSVISLAVGNPIGACNKAYFVAVQKIEIKPDIINKLELFFVPAGAPLQVTLSEGNFSKVVGAYIGGIFSFDINGENWTRECYPYVDNEILVNNLYIPWGAENIRWSFSDVDGVWQKRALFMDEKSLSEGRTEGIPVSSLDTIVEVKIKFPE